MKEPSVLDYLKSMLPWSKTKVELADPITESGPSDNGLPSTDLGTPKTSNFRLPSALPWRTFLALLLALFAQFTLDPTGFAFGPDTSQSLRDSNFEDAALRGVIIYGIAVALLLWAYFVKEFSLPSLPPENAETDPQTVRYIAITVAAVLSFVAFLAFDNNLFTVPNVTLWILGLAFYLRSLWLYEKRQPVVTAEDDVILPETPRPAFSLAGLLTKWWDAGLFLFIAFLGSQGFGNNIFLFGLVPLLIAGTIIWLRAPYTITTPWQHLKTWMTRDTWQINLTRWTLLILAISAVVIFFRLYRLDGVPIEPFSDQAEKLLDVYDVTQGQTHIFFERNTGREFIQFYWTALMSFLFNTGITFISLKIGTALIGLLTLPYIYLLGKEIGGPRVALFALILAGIAYWPNTISRIGLRFPLYMAFVAPTLYYLIKALRTQNRNHFILAGIFLGLGLHGYSPFRFVPFVVIAAVAIYLLHKPAQGRRKQVLILSGILVLTSLLVFLPLGRYAMEHPEMFGERAFTRLTETEQPLPIQEWCPIQDNKQATAACIFAMNTYKAMMMMVWDNGSIWVHSVPGRPALDIVGAVLFAIGYIFLFIRYLMHRRWQDIFLLVSVPLLLMPSILSLAFPDENPSLNRTSGTLVAVFVIAAVALDGVYTALRGDQSGRIQRGFAVGVVTVLVGMSMLQNYDLVFNKFDLSFQAGAWNTSDIGKVVRAFMVEGHSPDNVWVIPYPHWVDTRLAGIQAGLPTKDFALDRDTLRERLTETLAIPGVKLFIVKDEDQETLTLLREFYPSGLIGKFDSHLEGKDFWIYTIPDSQAVVAP